jgi:hypothetical protein
MPASTVVAARSLAGEMRGGPITSASVRSILHAGVAYGRKQHLLANSSRLRCSSLCCLQLHSCPFARWRDAVDKLSCTIHMRQEVTRCDDAPHAHWRNARHRAAEALAVISFVRSPCPWNFNSLNDKQPRKNEKRSTCTSSVVFSIAAAAPGSRRPVRSLARCRATWPETSCSAARTCLSSRGRLQLRPAHVAPFARWRDVGRRGRRPPVLQPTLASVHGAAP